MNSDTLTLILIAFGALVYLGLYIGSLLWLYEDARRRGSAGWALVALIGLFFWPVGLFIWLLVRPPIGFKKPPVRRKDGSRACPECSFLVVSDDPRCPNCGRKFQPFI